MAPLSREHRLNVGIAVVVVGVCALARPALAQSAPPTLSGWARCQIDVQGAGYSEQAVHTWTITRGAPTISGAFRVYAGTWSVVGRGSFQRGDGSQSLIAQWAINGNAPAPIAVFVRASDGRVLVQARHAQLRAAGAIAGYQQQFIDGIPRKPASINAEAFEWAFPAADAPATNTAISGSSTPTVTGRVGHMQPADSRATASCTWQFGLGSAVPVAPPTLAAQPIPTPASTSSPAVAAERGRARSSP